jgi:tRNA-dihydrouridine synthase
VCTPERARECFERYGVDAVMIGRATFGNPWLFAEIKEFLSTPSIPITPITPTTQSIPTTLIPRSMSEKVAILKEHVLASIEWCGNDERKGIIHSRRHFAASPIFKGLPDFRQTRIALLRADTKDEVFSIMDSIVNRYASQVDDEVLKNESVNRYASLVDQNSGIPELQNSPNSMQQ